MRWKRRMWVKSKARRTCPSPFNFCSGCGNGCLLHSPHKQHPELGITTAQKSSSPVREADRGFCGTVGRPARLGFVDCSGGFGLVGVLEELLAFAPASAFGSAFEFFSDDAETASPLFDANRLSGRVCCCLGTEINIHKKESLLQHRRLHAQVEWCGRYHHKLTHVLLCVGGSLMSYSKSLQAKCVNLLFLTCAKICDSIAKTRIAYPPF